MKRLGIAIGLLCAVLACTPQPAKPRDVTASGTVTVVSDGPLKTRPFRFFEGDGVISHNLLTREFTNVVGMQEGDALVTPQVPGGPYFLKSANVYCFTSQANLDTSLTRVGRDDLRFAGANTRLQLMLTGLLPWFDDGNLADSMEFYSAGAGLYDFAFERRGVAPSSGSTTLNGTLDYLTGTGLVEAAKGDRLTITQLSAQELSGEDLTYFAVRRAATVNVNVASGGTTTVTTALQSLSTRTNSFTINVATFDALKRTVNPDFGTFRISVQVVAVPPGASPLSIDPPDLMYLIVFFTGVGTLPTDLGGAFSYGNPFTSFTEVALVQGLYPVSYTDGRGASATFNGGVGHYMPVEELRTGTHVPRLTPPQAFKIDGKDGFTDLSIKETPELTWDAPATGTARGYYVDIFKIADGPSFEFQARLRLKERKVTVPPGILISGSRYFMRLRAVNAGADVDKTPFVETVPMSFADVLSGVLTP